tara:strand:- start:74 stop:811 length:738 start_codon:yes stop_codon:yes gene_type:complete
MSEIDALGYLLYPRKNNRVYSVSEINAKRLKVYNRVKTKLTSLYSGSVDEIIQHLATDTRKGGFNVIFYIVHCIKDAFLWYRDADGITNIMDNTFFVCKWNPRTTTSIATSAANSKPWVIDIEVSKQIFAYGVDYDSGEEINRNGNLVYRDRKHKMVFGVKAEDSLKILIVILEHELCHAILQRRSRRRDDSVRMDSKLKHGYQCDLHHNIYFTDLAKRLFGHNMVVARVGMVGKRRSKRIRLQY